MVTRVHSARGGFAAGLRWPVALVFVLVIAGLLPARALAGIILVQHTSKDAGITASSSLAFPANNTAGNWIGVVIRGGHSGQVFTISDTRGNTYKQAVQFNQTLDGPGGETLAIFYTENIAGGANSVTVSESLGNNTLRFAIFEYSGVALSNSIDVTAAAQGSGTTLNSGPATTTASSDLILGEVTTADGLTYTAGSGFVIEERVPAAPNTKLMAEDAIQAVAGSVSVGATLSSSDNGGALLAAFKAASGTLPPSITSVSPTSSRVAYAVTIYGANFGGAQGSSKVTFNGIPTTPITWSATSILVPVPNVSSAGTTTVVVTVGGIASNGVNITVTPGVTSLSPSSGPVGTSVTITGTEFGATQASSTVMFSGTLTPATPTSWSDTSITAPVPTSAVVGTNGVVVTVNGIQSVSNSVNFVVTPGISGVSPGSGPIGTSVTIVGTSFGISQGPSTVTFNGVSAGTASSWSASSITVNVPSGASTGNVVVTVGGVASNPVAFTVVGPPASMTANTGTTPQSAPVSTAFASPLAVTVKDAASNPVSGVSVTFTAPGSGSSGTFSNSTATITVATNASGVASAPFTANATAGGPYTVTATVTGVTAVNFSLTNTVGAAASITANAGTTPQSASINTAFATPLAVTVKDAGGNPVSGVNVTFTAPGSGASGIFSNSTATITVATNASGVASAPFTANATAGGYYLVTATITGIATVFDLYNVGAPATISANAGTTPQSATISTAFATPLAVTVKDAFGNPVSGVNVTFTAPGSGASGLFSNSTATITVATNASGIASASFAANATAGGPYTVTATASGLTMVNFSLTNNAGAPAPITLVQHTSKDAGITSSSSLAFPANNAAGNWIGVVIRAGHANQVLAVSDSRANTYHQAVLFNQTLDAPNGETLAIFYAENIAGGANTVTVSESLGNNTLRFAILEYSGVALANSIDVTAAGQASGTTLSSGSATTTANGDLILGDVATADGVTYTAGSGFTIEERVPAAPNTKLVAEDVIQAAAGSMAVSATLSSSDNGAALLAAFKSASGSPAGPIISSLNPSNGPVGTPVTISGANFGLSQGTSTVTFHGVSAGTAGSWSPTSITVNVPAGATSGNVVVTVNGVASNPANFNVIVPGSGLITLVQHASNDAGVASSSSLAFASSNTVGNFIAVVIRGGKQGQVFAVSDSLANTYKQAIQSNLSVDAETVAIYYAENIAGGANTVTVSQSIANNTLRFAILEYSGVAASGSLDTTAFAQGSDTAPSSGNTATSGVGELLIAEMTNAGGSTFGAGSGLAMEEAVPAPPNSVLLVEDGIQPLPGVVSGTASLAALDNWGAMLAAFKPAAGAAGPHIVSVNPGTAPAGALITIAGTNFGASRGASTVTFSGTTATPRSWSSTSIVVAVPAGAVSGNVVVTVGGTASNSVNFTVGFAPGIAFVQVNSNIDIDAPLPISQNFVSVLYKGAQTAGNLNVVVVGWRGSSATITSVTDTAGNVYTLAVGPTVIGGTATQAIYYAKDILGSPPNTNVVTVTFSGLSTTPNMRIAEYAGLDPNNPLDVAAAGQGNSSTSSSGSVTTTNANDLLVGGNLVYTNTSGAGAGYTSRVISQDGGILEDEIVSATGSYSATAPLSGSGSWIMQMAAFKAPAAAAPAITVAVSPGTANTPTGYGTQNFGVTLQNDVQRLGATWSLSGSGCSGNTCGTLTNVTLTSVTYAAPANLPSPATVTITATSIADPTKSAGATITITQGSLNVAISPKRAAVTLTQTQQFSAPVTNDPPNAGVLWSVDGNNGGNSTTGTISSTGLFTPGTQAGVHTVTATSVSNASVNASATIAVTDIAGVFGYHYDSQSTGQNTKEYALTTSTVTPATFGLLFNCSVDGFMFASPLYVPNMTINSQTHNVLFIATEHASVYAFDADSPSCTQLWKTSLLSVGVMTVPPGDTGDGVSLITEFGITSTPVIDPASNTIYVVANTKEIVGSGCSPTSPCYLYRLHALDLATGAEKFGGPVLVSAPNFNPLHQLQRPGLLLNNGTVYIAFGSHGDLNTWQGWLMAYAYNGTTLAQVFAWPATVPTGTNNKGAIWGAGNPPVADAGGNVYVVTGNGTFDGTQNYGDSVIKVTSAGGVADYFSPFDQSTLSGNDVDLGSAGAIILPDSVGSSTHQHLVLATGKVGVLYLLDQTNMGKFHNGSNSDVQEVNVGFNNSNGDNGFFGQPAYWNGNLYTVMTGDSLRQFPISNAVITNPASSVATKIYPYRGATPSVSSSGTTNGIVWVLDVNTFEFNGPSILDAYDASHAATMLFSSPPGGAGAACSTSKFTSPVVANGKVYVSGSNCFAVFGLSPN